MWYLMFRVPLHFAAIPEKKILNACNRFNLPLDTWRRPERAFGSLRKVYAKRAAIRGQQPTAIPSWAQQAEGFGNRILLPRMLALSTNEWSNRCDDSSVEVSWKKFRKSLAPMIELLSLRR
jgi:hypothetical protein